MSEEYVHYKTIKSCYCLQKAKLKVWIKQGRLRTKRVYCLADVHQCMKIKKEG